MKSLYAAGGCTVCRDRTPSVGHSTGGLYVKVTQQASHLVAVALLQLQHMGYKPQVNTGMDG